MQFDNFSNSKKIPWKWTNLVKHAIWQFFQFRKIATSLYLPHDDILDCFFLVLSCVVLLTGIWHNISTDIFYLTQVWACWICEIQEQLEVTICSPSLEQIFAMLNQTDQMCSSHSKMQDSFSVYLYFCILYQIHPGWIDLSKFRLSPIMRSASSWCTGFSRFQSVPVTLVHHTVLSQLSYVFFFVKKCTESSCQWWGWVSWEVVCIVTNVCISCHVKMLDCIIIEYFCFFFQCCSFIKIL